MTRVGARRIAEIDPAVLRALEAGRDETRTLVEWLAIDQAKLLAAALPECGLAAREVAAAVAAARERAALGIMERTQGAGAQLRSLLADRPARERSALHDALASHRSDMVRTFAAYVDRADEALPLARRLERARRFAADRAMSVREAAWDAIRPWLARELAAGLALLRAWVADADPNVRRCAIECSRPRGVWTRHLEPLKADPSPGLPLLEPCRADASDYVRRAVGNWLNDASKSQPRFVRTLCARWSRESPTRETAWIVRHALRTLSRA